MKLFAILVDIFFKTTHYYSLFKKEEIESTMGMVYFSHEKYLCDHKKKKKTLTKFVSPNY